MGGSLGPSGEDGFGYGFNVGFAPARPACPACAGGVMRSGHEIQALDRCGFVREVPARPDRPAVAGVDRH